MIRSAVVLLLAASLVRSAVGQAATASAAPARPHLTALSYNIHYAVGMDGKTDLARIARVIRDSKAGIVGLQEISNKAMAEELSMLGAGVTATDVDAGVEARLQAIRDIRELLLLQTKSQVRAHALSDIGKSDLQMATTPLICPDLRHRATTSNRWSSSRLTTARFG